MFPGLRDLGISLGIEGFRGLGFRVKGFKGFGGDLEAPPREWRLLANPIAPLEISFVLYKNSKGSSKIVMLIEVLRRI